MTSKISMMVVAALVFAGCNSSKSLTTDTDTDAPDDTTTADTAEDSPDVVEDTADPDTSVDPDVVEDTGTPDLPDTTDPPADTPTDTVGMPCEEDGECDNGVFCDGTEYCHPAGECRRSPPPDCDDGDPCTEDACDAATDACVNVLMDDDGDGVPPESCGGGDCDDTNPDIHPGAEDICMDGIDQDCSGEDAPEGSCACPVSVSVPSTTSGDTTGMPNVLDPSCMTSSYTGPEVVHELVLDAETSVRIDIGSFYGYVHIHDGSCLGTEIACASYYDEALRETLPAGTYWIWVDGMGTWGSGAYTLTLGEYVPPVPVTGNDTCSDAFEITADGSWSGDTTGMTHTVDGSCGYGGARDAWFTFTLSSASHVILDTMDSALDTVLYVISGTCSGAELACDDMSGPGMTSRLELDLDPGTYYVVVDGYYHTYYDDYILTVSGL